LITQYIITANEWTPVTTAGQSGTCWINEDNDAAVGRQDVRIYPSLTLPVLADISKAKRVYRPNGNEDVLGFDANGTLEVLYARCFNQSDVATLHVSVN